MDSLGRSFLNFGGWGCLGTHENSSFFMECKIRFSFLVLLVIIVRVVQGF